MKKNVRAIIKGFMAAALLAGLSSCSNGSSDDFTTGLNSAANSTDSTTTQQTQEQQGDTFSGELITFTATSASVSAENTVLIIKYDRSAAGADEQITLGKVNLEVSVNDAAVAMPDTLILELDPYSSLKPGYNYQAEEEAAYQKEYKIKLPLGKQLSVGDVVKVQLKNATVSGAGAASVQLGSIVVSLIDIAPAANYYKELCANEYQCLITQKNGADLNAAENTAEEPAATPAADQNNNAEVTPAPAPAATTTPATTVVFEGEQALAWTPEGTNVCLDKSKFTGTKKNIEITYKKDGDGSVIQLINRTGWAKMVITSKVTGNVATGEATDELYPWGPSEDGSITEWTFTFTPSDDDWTGITAEGFAIQGNGTKIKKVELK